MNVDNGEVLALGSQPSYDPNLFAKIVRESDFRRLTADETGSPLTNRAVAAGYLTGSTFKLITATAALESGLITPDTPLNDPGELTVGDQVFKNAGEVAHGVLALRQALTVSSDVFFYQLGRDMNQEGMPLQHWARRLGVGRETGIDLPEEGPGFVPGPEVARSPVREVPALRRPHQPHADRDLARQVRLAGPAVVGRRQRQPVGRAGRPRRQPAADGGGVRGDRQRRQGPAAAARPADRELGRPGAAAATGADGAQAGRLRGQPAGDPRRPARRRQRAGRHLDAGVRDASRSRSPARPARPRRATGAPTSRGTWRWRRGPTPSTWSP